jgi:glycosyltransferase involved in cell wall biosynthesis
MKELAVVLITKNQAWNIERLIESVLRATAGLASGEIWLVDSASTDQTVALAKNYPVNIVRIQSDLALTPAAGRYLGYKYSRGTYVLFLDGDMELFPSWLERAFRVMEEDSTAAVVTGNVIDLPIPVAGFRGPFRVIGNGEVVEVPRCGGAALYRRDVLEQAGTFNPYLCSDEEPELCLRIRHAGYRIIQLRHPIVNHYTEPDETLSGVVSRRRRRFYVGAGQVLRYHFGTRLWWPYVKERGFAFVPAFALIAGLLSLVWAAWTRDWSWFGYWCLMLIVVVVGDAIRKRSVHRTIVSLVKRLFTIEGTVIGLRMKALAPETYSATLDLILELNKNQHDSIENEDARVG